MADNISTQGTAVLQDLIKKLFPPEGKSERVAEALAAFHQESPIQLSPADWKWVAEGADVEDQF